MKKKIVKQTVAAALLTSSIFSFTPVTYGKEMTIQQSIDAVKLEMKHAPLFYVDPAFKSVIEPSKELYPILDNVKKHYKEVKQQIQTSKLSAKEKKAKITELDALYEEKIAKGVIPYIDAYNYAVKYLDPILKEMLDAHAKGDLAGVEQAYHKLSYQLDSRTSILYRFTGKAPRDLLLEKYKKPSDAKRDELRIPVTIYMKNNEVVRLWKEGKKEEARKVMDEVLALAAKSSNDGKTNYSNLLSKEVKEAEALFLTNPPEVPGNPSMNGGNNQGQSESSAERRLRLAKANAITELNTYKEIDKDDYSEENWSTIQSLKTTWTSTINSAKTQNEVEEALNNVKAEIDRVKTSAQEALDEAKNQALAELTAYKETVKDDYSEGNWSTIQSVKTTWTSAINSAKTPNEVEEALNNAKAEIEQVKTSAQEALDEAQNQALAELTAYKETIKNEYSTTNWDTITSLKTKWEDIINSATTPTEVAEALNHAKVEIEAVQTIAQEALAEAKTQGLVELTAYKETVKNEYSTTNWNTITSLKTKWADIIKSASTPNEVAEALNHAKAEIEAVQTIVQEALAEAKTQGLVELTTYKETVKNEYSTTNWDTITSLKTKWEDIINSATTSTEVTEALKNAKAEINAVQTIAQEALAESKSQAVVVLTAYKETVKNEYSTTNWNIITSLKTKWEDIINSASTSTEVTEALKNAKAEINAVQTIAQEALAESKTQGLVELTAYKETIKNEYSTTNWDTITSLKTKWEDIINSATTPNEVAEALINAKAEIEAVQTIPQEALAEAKTQGLVELTAYKETVKNEYSTTNWDTITSLKTKWTDIINSATTSTEVTEALQNAEEEIEAVQTIAQEALADAKTQGLVELTAYKETVKNEYSKTNWDTITSLKTKWADIINSATTPTEVAEALQNAEAEINAVQTIAQEALAESKSQAVVQLTAYKETVKNEYSPTNWDIITSLKTTWEDIINSATTTTQVEQALSDAKAAIDAVETMVQEALAIAKSNAINQLSTYKEAEQDEYSPENWATITSLKTTWTDIINSAPTQTQVEQALSDAKAAIDAVKTRNHVPTVENSIADQNAQVGTGNIILDASRTFKDIDGDALTLSAVSSDRTKAIVTVYGKNIVVTPLAKGTTMITLTANDGNGGIASVTFNVVVTEQQKLTANNIVINSNNDISPLVITFDTPLADSTLEILNINNLLGSYPRLIAYLSNGYMANIPLHSIEWDTTNVNSPKLILYSTHSYRTLPANTVKIEVKFESNALKTLDNKIYEKAELNILQP